MTTMRRLSSYCTISLSTIVTLRRNESSSLTDGVSFSRLRTLQQLHTGFGLWLSSLLRRIMVFVYGGMGVDDSAFDLISRGTSSRETFICGVLIVSNTVIVQLAVVSLLAPLKAPMVSSDEDRGVGEWKQVPVLPGLPTLVGGVAGGVSAVGWSVFAVSSRCKTKRWWVPLLLTTCLTISLVGLGLAVVASIMVPDATCGNWIIYLATTVTFAGSTPQLPLALHQIYAVLDTELGAPRDSRQGIRWERLGAMISILTTIAGSQLLTAWVFLMPDAAQKVFLFTSAVLAIGGSVWLMLRHTRGSVVAIETG